MLGRKEPSMMIIGCDFHPSWQQVSWLDTETGGGAEAGACFGRREAFLSATGGAGADRHGGHGQQPVVHRVGRRSGTRNLDRRGGTDPGQLRAQAEDGQARRGTYFKAGGGRPFSAALDSGPGAARPAATGAAPAQTGGDSQPSQKRT